VLGYHAVRPDYQGLMGVSGWFGRGKRPRPHGVVPHFNKHKTCLVRKYEIFHERQGPSTNGPNTKKLYEKSQSNGPRCENARHLSKYGPQLRIAPLASLHQPKASFSVKPGSDNRVSPWPTVSPFAATSVIYRLGCYCCWYQCRLVALVACRTLVSIRSLSPSAHSQ